MYGPIKALSRPHHGPHARTGPKISASLGIESDGGFPPDVDVVRDLIGEWLTPMTPDERAKARQLIVAVIAGRVKLPDGGDVPHIADG